MTASKEIKKALKAAFPTVKFSVTTKHSLCETVTVEWTGGAFINEVKEACTPWNTFKNHSDAMTDYFHYTGIQIKYERNLSDEEIEMLKEEIPKHYPTIINGRSVEWDKLHNQFSWLDSNGEYDWRSDFGYRQLSANKAVKNYLETGSIEVSEEDKLSERVMLSQINYTWEYKQPQSNVIEFPSPEVEITESNSDYPSFEVVGETVERDYKEGDEQPCPYWFKVQGKLIDVRRISGYQSLCADNEDKIYEIYMSKYKTRHDYPTYQEWQYTEWIPYVSQLIEKYLIEPQPVPTTEQEFNAVKNAQIDDLKTRYEQ
jgi:hypothetical protein